MSNINNKLIFEITDETKKKLKKVGLALGGAALAGGLGYGAYKGNKYLLNKENANIEAARKGWNIAQHGVNAGIIYNKTTGLFGNKIKSIPASLYLAKNFRNAKVRDKQSTIQQGMNKLVDKWSGADNKLKMLFNHHKINKRRLLMTHAANTLYAGAKIGGQHLLNTGKVNNHLSKLGLNFLSKAAQSMA